MRIINIILNNRIYKYSLYAIFNKYLITFISINDC